MQALRPKDLINTLSDASVKFGQRYPDWFNLLMKKEGCYSVVHFRF